MHIAIAGCRGVPGLYSGFETAATEIGVRLVERGHEVSVYCRRGYGAPSETFYRGIRKVYLPQLNLKVAETVSHTLVCLLHAFLRPPDVLIVMNPANGPLLVLPRLRGTPVAINVDGMEWKRTKWSRLGRRYLYFASWCCTKIASEIVADSHALQDFYRSTWNVDPYYASYGAAVESPAPPDLVRESGLEPNEYFLVVARLEPENNTELIVRAFGGVSTDKKLFVVGGTTYRSRYMEQLKEKTSDRRVIFAGPIYDQRRLTDLMCHCFAYVHGHMVGGTNPVLLKAMGCGSRVLVLDTEFNVEVVSDAGLTFPRDVDGARQLFQRVVDRPGEADAARARTRQRVQEAYTWKMAADRYEALCQRLRES